MNIKEFIKEEGRQEGRQEGVHEGVQKGLRQGVQKGMRQAALNMLRKKTDIDFVSDVTGLPLDEIKKLQNGS